MKTRIYKIEDLNLKHVQKDIKHTIANGHQVIFPTETVYGIGADAFSDQGIKGIYQVKGRPSDNPLIMHIKDQKDVLKYATDIKDYVFLLMDHFWPGPLTLVLKKQPFIPDLITGGLNTVGIRMPNHEGALKVIEIAQTALCAPSANVSGKPSSTRFEHVLNDFNDRVDIIIDGGKSLLGLESTVLDVTKDIPVILRPGVVTEKMIFDVLGHVNKKEKVSDDEVPKAPGMKYKHYAPESDLFILKGDDQDVIHYINQQIGNHQKVGVITTSNLKDQFKGAFVYDIGDPNKDEEIASNLFDAIRAMDMHHVDVIYSFMFDQGQYKDALMNRLLKAANHQVIDV